MLTTERASLMLLALLMLAGCNKTQLAGKGCQTDAECGTPASAFRCEVETGSCLCRTDEACPGSQFCNTIGYCQDPAGCEKNTDCLDATLVCDLSRGVCTARGRCTSDLQCMLGEVCDLSTLSCVEGCRANGDCPGIACLCGNKACRCEGDRSKCAIGKCDVRFCDGNQFCKFGETCRTRNGTSTCVDDYDTQARPYCDACMPGQGTCGVSGSNFCLIDTRNLGSFYCGADCGKGQTCPRGFQCEEVVVPPSQVPCDPMTLACAPNKALPCTDDSACLHGRCVKPVGAASGSCAALCTVREGDKAGYCGCQLDSDCAQEQCTAAGFCSVTQEPCSSAAPCPRIQCVDVGGIGGCMVGKNCAPSDGLSCDEAHGRR